MIKNKYESPEIFVSAVVCNEDLLADNDKGDVILSYPAQSGENDVSDWWNS